MNDRERLSTLLRQLEALDGLNEDRFGRLVAELERPATRKGHDEHGRLRVSIFDAKSYDVASFDQCDRGRHALHYIEASLGPGTAAAAEGSKVVCIFVNDQCDATVAGQLASHGVELIALRCAGYNNVDLDGCQKAGLSVVRVPAYSPYAVAEHAVALMLMLNRRLHLAYLRNRTGSFVLDGLTGFDMRDKTVGVVGTGKIGRCVIDILLGFGCRVLAFDRFPNPALAKRAGVDYVDAKRLFHESHIVTLHAPLLPETHHLVDAEAIATAKDGIMLINTSRGGLVDTRALIEGLKSGKVGAAGLDVYEEESGVFFHDVSDQVLSDDVLARLLTFNNVVVTSHQGFLTREALANIAETTIANIEEYEQGRRGADLTNAVRSEPAAEGA